MNRKLYFACFFVASILVFTITMSGFSQEASFKIQGGISLYFDGSIYRNSHGGNLKNGCEGWQTLAGSESIFASRCDVERLNRLGLYAGEAVQVNDKLMEARKIKAQNQYLMMDFTTSKVQALHGLTPRNVAVYLIFDSNKKFLYYRATGERGLLRNMGFDIDGLLKANDALTAEKKIQVSGQTLNVAEENGRQMIIGKTKDGKISALFIDKNGKKAGQTFLK